MYDTRAAYAGNLPFMTVMRYLSKCLVLFRLGFCLLCGWLCRRVFGTSLGELGAGTATGRRWFSMLRLVAGTRTLM